MRMSAPVRCPVTESRAHPLANPMTPGGNPSPDMIWPLPSNITGFCAADLHEPTTSLNCGTVATSAPVTYAPADKIGPAFENEIVAVGTDCQTANMFCTRCSPAALSMTVALLGLTAIGPGSSRYWIGIFPGSQVNGCASVPNFGPPTTSGPPA